jgi:hypothetical protein
MPEEVSHKEVLIMPTPPSASREPKVASAQSKLIEAVVLLQPPADGSLPDPAQSKAMAKVVLSNVEKQTGLSPDASTVFENMHSFSVRASKQFMDALARADGVAQMLPNAMPGSGMIEPVKKTPVKLPK